MDANLERWRSDTPAAAAGRIHLNNAGASLMPQPVLDAVLAHLELESRIGGYEAADAAEAEILAAYESVARLVGAAARNIAMVENATVGFFQALAAFDFERGDVIVTTRNDYISNQLAYLSLERRAGVRVVRAEDLPEGGVDPESVRALVRRERPKVVTLTWVPTNSGLVQPAEAVGAVCEEAGVPYVVDACQAAGQLPIDVAALRCDFLSATARKFLRGPRGAGFLYISDRALARGAYPLFVDMRGAAWVDADEFRLARDARRFENWEFAYALVLGQGAAARYALDAVGIERGGARATRLAAYTRDRLREHAGLRVLDRGARLCAIVTVEVAGRSAFELVPLLHEQGINTSATARDYAVLDMDDKGARTAIRISPHYYNTEAEIDAAVTVIAALARPGS